MRILAELVLVSESLELESKVMHLKKTKESIEVEITRKGDLRPRKKKFIQKDTWLILKMKCREYEYNEDIMKLIEIFNELIDSVNQNDIKESYIEIIIYSDEGIGIVNLEFDLKVIEALFLSNLGLPISIYREKTE